MKDYVSSRLKMKHKVFHVSACVEGVDVFLWDGVLLKRFLEEVVNSNESTAGRIKLTVTMTEELKEI